MGFQRENAYKMQGQQLIPDSKSLASGSLISDALVESKRLDHTHMVVPLG